MKVTLKIITVLFISLLMNCGSKEEKKKESFSYEKKEIPVKKEIKKEESVPPSELIDLSNKGIGPIKSLVLNDKIDQRMAKHGSEVFNNLCTICHRVDKKFIGPAPNGITERRTPEWIMNMILNPVKMTQKDPLAKALLKEFNGAPMMNQNLSEGDARAILEYFRTL